jgi:AhpD family alkylhydroperoxidase
MSAPVAPRIEPRVGPGGRRDVGILGWVIAAVGGRAVGTRPLHLFLTLGRHRRLFLGWLHFSGRLMPGGRLPRRETELVILRVAHLRGCAYEFEHHVAMSRRAGVRPPDIDRVVQGPDRPGWTARERAVLTAVDELHADRDVGDSTWTELRRHLDEREAIELCLLVGNYESLATTITALRIQPDEPRPRRRRRG